MQVCIVYDSLVIRHAILSFFFSDLSRGKEANPIQCYNSVDAEPKPSNFCYITKNCYTLEDIKIEQKISSLQCCQCEDRCMDFGCLCGNMSVKCWYDEEGKLKPDLNFNGNGFGSLSLILIYFCL